MRAQSAAVLSDMDEGDFNRAFGAIRAVIQGAGDMGKRLASNELDGAIEFCGKLFEPKSFEEQQQEHRMLEEKTDEVDKPDEDRDVRDRLQKVHQAARGMHDDTYVGTSNFEDEPLEIGSHGYAVRLRKGELGLVSKY